MKQRWHEIVAQRVVVAERAVQNVSRAQCINHLHGLDCDLTVVIRNTIDNGALSTGDRPVSHTLASEILHNAIFVAPIWRKKMLGTNRDVNRGEQSLHPVLPTPTIEHDGYSALFGLRSYNATRFHVEPINENHTIVVLVYDTRHIARVRREQRCGGNNGAVASTRRHDRRHRRKLVG